MTTQQETEYWAVALLAVKSLRRLLTVHDAMGREAEQRQLNPATARELHAALLDAKATLAVAAKHGFAGALDD